VTRAQIVLSLLTIVASGLVSAVVTFRLNAGRDSRRMRREKLEAAFLAHSGFLRQLDVGWYPYYAVMGGEIEYNDALDLAIGKGTAAEPKHFETLAMLVSLYFPELQSGFARLVGIRDRAATLIQAHKNDYKRVGPHVSAARDEMKRLIDALTAHEAQFNADMASLARKLGASGKQAA
jgi:hypothetical protein